MKYIDEVIELKLCRKASNKICSKIEREKKVRNRIITDIPGIFELNKDQNNLKKK